jgi:hypothetical protein
VAGLHYGLSLLARDPAAAAAEFRRALELTYPPAARVQIYGDDYTLGPKYRWRGPGEVPATIVAVFGSASK